MDLNIIPFSTLQGALDAAEATDQETDRFNTHFHTHTEIAALIQESADGSHKHVYPDLTACYFVGYRPQALLATMEPKSDVRGLRSTSGHLLVPTGAYWSLKPSGRSPEVAHDDSTG